MYTYYIYNKHNILSLKNTYANTILKCKKVSYNRASFYKNSITIILLKSFRNCKRRKKGNFTLKSNSYKI